MFPVPRSEIRDIKVPTADEITKAYIELMKSLERSNIAYREKTDRDLDSREISDQTVSPVPKAAVNVIGDSAVATRLDSDQNSRSSSGASAPTMRNEVGKLNGGNSVLHDDQHRNGGTGPGEKARGFEVDKEDSNSTVGSDSRSSNFVFVQGSNTVESKGYDEESSDDAHYADKHLNEEAQIALIASDAESDDVLLTADNIEKYEGSMDNDQLLESVKGLHFAQVGFQREVQKWRDVGKGDPLIFDDPLHEILELKDSKILELETILNSGDIKTTLEDQLVKIIQTEVEYVVLTTTTKLLTEVPLCEIRHGHDDLQQKSDSSQEMQDEKLQTKEDLKQLQNKVCQFTSCFIIMLVLLLVTLYLQFSPQYVEVVPT